MSELTTRVTAISEVQPGVYRLTLEDGAQWQFAESVASSYRRPQTGSAITIERGSLGGFLLSYDGQAAVRVRRNR